LIEDYMRVRLSLCSAAIMLCGCYASFPIDIAQAKPGTKLRVGLTDAGSDSLARYLGPGVESVDGKLLRSADTDVALGVTQISMRSGIDQYWKGESVVLPKYSVATVLERRLSKPRTFLLAGAIIAALASVKLSGVGGSSGAPNSHGGGGPK
jgi:hypothetical protein